MNICIRPAVIEDSFQISKLITQLGYPTTQTEMQEILQNFLRNKNYYAFLATIENEIVGSVSLIINNFFHKIGKNAIIASMVIDEKYRGKGIGQLLISYVENKARSEGCEFIELKSGIRRIKDGTHNFYKKLGYFDNVVNQTSFKKIF